MLPYVVLFALTALPPIVLELIATFGDHTVPKGQCEGIGGGCVLSHADTAKFLLIFALPLTVVLASVGVLALALMRRARAYRLLPGIVQGLIPASPALILILLFLVV